MDQTCFAYAISVYQSYLVHKYYRAMMHIRVYETLYHNNTAKSSTSRPCCVVEYPWLLQQPQGKWNCRLPEASVQDCGRVHVHHSHALFCSSLYWNSFVSTAVGLLTVIFFSIEPLYLREGYEFKVCSDTESNCWVILKNGET